MILYFDCQTGVSGDMLIASLLDHGTSLEFLENELKKLGLDSYKLKLNEKQVAGIKTMHLDVIQIKQEQLRHLSHINEIIDKSTLSEKIKDNSKRTFMTIAKAEAKVHDIPIQKIHFHEVGAVDTIVDIVGCFVLLEKLKPDRVLSSKINLGSGFVTMSHGRHPVPAPAVVEIAKNMRVFSTDMGMETATPTGIAIMKNIVDESGNIPESEIISVGYGSGTYSSDEKPTYVRSMLLKD